MEKLRTYPGKYYKKIKNYFLPERSKEYQRMLAGIRVYFSLMKQRSFMNFLFLLLFTSFFILIPVIWVNIQKASLPILSVIYNGLSFTSFFILFLLLMFLFLIYWQHDFKVIRGIKIFFKNPFSFIIIVFMIFFIPLTFFQSQQSSLIEIITAIITSSIFLFMFILLFSLSLLRPGSLLNYAAEKLLMTSENIKSHRLGKSEYYAQYYYSVLTYYKMISKRFRGVYQDDILIRTKSQLIPLLCSQGLINKTEDKELLIKILKDLSEINPLENPYEFSMKMEFIENNLLKDITEEKRIKIYGILRDKTGKEKLREYLFYIVTILSILSAIINTFFRDLILSLLKGVF